MTFDVLRVLMTLEVILVLGMEMVQVCDFFFSGVSSEIEMHTF